MPRVKVSTQIRLAHVQGQSPGLMNIKYFQACSQVCLQNRERLAKKILVSGMLLHL